MHLFVSGGLAPPHSPSFADRRHLHQSDHHHHNHHHHQHDRNHHDNERLTAGSGQSTGVSALNVPALGARTADGTAL